MLSKERLESRKLMFAKPSTRLRRSSKLATVVDKC